MLIKIVLKLFISVIDAKLFEAVASFEILEAEYVENADTVALMIAKSVFLREKSVIDLENDPVEESTVETLSHGVARRYRLG